jgi:hypothetical protein
MKQVLLLSIVGIVLFLIFANKDKGSKEPSQREIQDLSYVVDRDESGILQGPVLSEFKGLPYPQISKGFTKLTKGPLPEPLKKLVNKIPSSFTRVRHLDTPSTMSPERMYLPDYYRKDTMDGDDRVLSEMRPFVEDVEGDNDSDSAWTDENVSEHPKFYNSNLKGDELTNIGGFFDENNQFSDTTSCNTYALPSDNCYKDKQGKKFCMDNTRLQAVPPALITNPRKNSALNTIGLYKDRKPSKDRDKFFGSVTGSRGLGHNETYAEPIQRQYGSCNA